MRADRHRAQAVGEHEVEPFRARRPRCRSGAPTNRRTPRRSGGPSARRGGWWPTRRVGAGAVGEPVLGRHRLRDRAARRRPSSTIVHHCSTANRPSASTCSRCTATWVPARDVRTAESCDQVSSVSPGASGRCTTMSCSPCTPPRTRCPCLGRQVCPCGLDRLEDENHREDGRDCVAAADRRGVVTGRCGIGGNTVRIQPAGERAVPRGVDRHMSGMVTTFSRLEKVILEGRICLMRFTITHPMHSHPYNPELVSGSGIATVAAAAEAAGFHGFGFTDHPAPSQRWLESGGHDALDPFVAMGYAAARTTTLRLIPNIVVLPYRNPFVVAKSGATLDMLSDGRFTLAVGVGYLKREFTALGVDFDDRAALFEEALEVIRAIWTTDDYLLRRQAFHREGHHRASASGQQAAPSHLDRRQHGGGQEARDHLRRRLVSVSRARHARADRPHGRTGIGGQPRAKASPICAAGATRRAGTGRASTSPSPTSAAVIPAMTTSTATRICPGWKSLRRWGLPGFRSACRATAWRTRWRPSSDSGHRSSPRNGHRYAVTRAMSATSPSAPKACASATPLRRPTRKAVPA